MASTATVPVGREQQLPDTTKSEGILDLDWLLQKKDPPGSLKRQKSNSEPRKAASDQPTESSEAQAETPKHLSKPAPAKTKEESVDPRHVSDHTPTTNGGGQQQIPSINVPKDNASLPQTPTKAQIPPSKNSPHVDNTRHQQPQQQQQERGGMKKESRRTSFFSGLTSKFSSSSTHNTPRNASVDSTKSNRSPMPSPGLFDKGNPFDTTKPAAKNGKEKKEEKIVVTPKSMPRRPSVLVAAGTETKLDSSPGFLSSAFRRLSSSNNVTLGKQATAGGICPRKVMNIDQNRQRTKIKEFDQNRLRRVAFKVDVEIAGISAQAEEQEHEGPSALSHVENPPASSSKESRMAKYKDRSEGAALKKSVSREEEDPDHSVIRRVSDALEAEAARAVAARAEAQAAEEEQKKAQEKEEAKNGTAAEKEADERQEPTNGEKPTTRKKEKKKRSEAERKERKERKRRHAEANGLVPLELTIDDDSDSSSNTPPDTGALKKGQPTTDPLRIYKRCCQLRETNALTQVKEQIQKPSTALAEIPGTVPSIDLSGIEMSLADIQTLGDWLAVVPVRRLILDDCDLSDEAVRIILSGLSGCKSQDQAKVNKKLPRRGSGKLGIEQMGVIEKLSLKNNVAISAIGWRYIALFMHMCRSLRAIDLSGVPFPATAGAELRRTSLTTTGDLSSSQELPPKHVDLSTLFARAINERFGDQLEELIMSGCGLAAHGISEIVDSSINRKIKRLGLAHNNMDLPAIEHVVRYVSSGICEGLDMGGNDLKGAGHLLTQVLNESNPLFAMSLADCNLTVGDLRVCLEQLSQLRNFKFIDLSRNRALFNESENAVGLLRRRLPAMKELKRIHLADVDMSPDQLISLCEIFPDVPALAHVSVLENQKLIECMNSTKGESQEVACAVFVSLMSAVRASKTLVALEIEVPGHDSSEVVKALSSQVLAYSLRNLERTTINDIGDSGAMQERFDKNAPEVLLHLVGHMEGYSENHDNDDPAPDEDYVIASTGIVKALGVCLENKELMGSHNITPTASGTATPTRSAPLLNKSVKKPRDVSLELCESARKIRLRLRPAMVKEDRAGNADAYRRLALLDQTLADMIKRFEDEYPESRPKLPSPGMLSVDSRHSSYIEGQTPDLRQVTSWDLDPTQKTLSNEHESNTSMAGRVLAQEEGRMHRFGQHMRREILKPTGQDDILHGTSINDEPEPEHLAAVRKRLEGYNGDAIRREVEEKGADRVIKELGINVQELRALEQEDPQAFEAFKESQLKAQINSGMIGREYTE